MMSVEWKAWAIVFMNTTPPTIYRDEHGQIDLWKSRDDARNWIETDMDYGPEEKPRAVKVTVTYSKTYSK
jgi:hypothetical protein